jgi:thiol-disulfide isomerase/thioredoxin
MKKIVLISCALLMAAQVWAEKKNLKITGKVSDMDSGIVVMGTLSDNKFDTMRFKNHSFVYEGFISEASPMVIADDKKRYQIFFADPNSKIEMEVQMQNMNVSSIKGSVSNDTMRRLTGLQEPMHQAAQQIQQAYQRPGINQDSLSQIMGLISQELQRTFRQFIREHAEMEISAFAVYSSLANDRNLNIAFADTLIGMLKGKARTSFYGKECDKLVNKIKAVTKGYMAPDFTLKDSSGKPYTLSKYRGKYVLLDFWASWCGPCKAEIPHMKKAYSAYHDKGFEIISISINAKEDAWRTALKQFQMPWVHILDVRGEKGSTTDLYHTPTIPKTLLLDKTGMIIDTDLRGTMLEQKLSQLLTD